ncbi:Dyp-type peroxidase [Amycolatopsis keratiniphila]|uniref:Peroxidase n=1 Tax=Amycolatopsis keratiniphila subsp. keratiniphila TaxID=227715 RepID=A0A1W2M4X6_9PSEU|nr:Dyp-type peroxidase [Amycolatopsis keratiniphila]ONF75008.1 peroxidase [Amycolatopsis keratiniphila subsp. keratiniphila]
MPQQYTSGHRRRRFLQGLVATAGAAALPAITSTEARARSTTEPVAFHGRHQAGVVTPQQPAGLFAAFDVRATGRAELERLLRTLTGRARALTTAGAEDSGGMLGPNPAADHLTVTVGVGASLFDHRYGLASHKPLGLTPMRAFPHDRLDPARCHGDLSLQLCADHHDTVLAALRDITRHLGDQITARWSIDGFLNPPRPTGVQRNLMGFKDGIENPDPASTAEMDRFVWVDGDGHEPGWAVGGTYQVLRIIRMNLEPWDRMTRAEQEHGFGRRHDTGAPLSGGGERETPDYTGDPHGRVTPLDSHARLANPRTPETDHQRILRRGYNYDRALDHTATHDLGVAFCCYQKDIQQQYEPIQTRLDGERLATLLTPIGGGYFYTLPGLRDTDDWYASRLMAAPH